jgi:hypothetical protein
LPERDEYRYGGRAFQAASYFAVRHLTRDRSRRTGATWAGEGRPPALHGAVAFGSLVRHAPRVAVRLTDSAEGQEIRRYLQARSQGLRWNRVAQGTLELPDDAAQYFRGKSRQAVRTNIRRAADSGLRCESIFDPAGFSSPVRAQLAAGVRDGGEESLEGGAHEPQWIVLDDAGNTLGCMAASIDKDCALLHYLSGESCEARYLLHSELVKHLCGQGVRHLLVVGASGLALSPGIQYFQHLLGYRIANLRVEAPRSARRPRRVPRYGLGAARRFDRVSVAAEPARPIV